MYLGFRIKNFMSIKDDVYIDFRANPSIPEHDYVLRDIDGVKILPVISVHGANASGKSNIIRAFLLFIKCLNAKNISDSPDIDITPFLLEENPNDVTELEAFVTCDSTEYRYGFGVKDKTIVKEWLFERQLSADTSVEWEPIFERDETDVKFNEKYSYYSAFKGVVNDNALLIRLLWRLEDSETDKMSMIYRTLSSIIATRASSMGADWYNTITDLYVSNKWLYQELVDFLKLIDPTIENLSFERDSSTQMIMAFTHRNNKRMPIVIESDGIKHLYELYGIIALALNNGSFIAIDDLDIMLHPPLFKKIVRMFNDKTINKNNAQLLFTSHNIIILDSRDLRRDEIWFTEKNTDGCTDIFSLTDFDSKAIDPETEYVENYLLGIFGAVPFQRQEHQ